MKSFITIAIGVLLAITNVNCKNHSEHKEESRVFTATTPIVLDTALTKDYVCQIHAMRHIELSAMEKGYLKLIAVDEGQRVRKGQLLFKIMPNVYEAELNKASAEARVVDVEYQNTKMLADSNIVSPNELALSKAKLDRANAEVALAKTHLGFTTIAAPFDGIIDHLFVREGSMLEEGAVLTTLSQTDKMWVYFNLPEVEYLNFMKVYGDNIHQKVQLQLANGEIFDQEGHIETIEGVFNNETGNIEFRAIFDNPQKLLRHGETGSILMSVPINNALIIPQKATFEILDKKYVFVIGDDNKVHQREIKVGPSFQHLFVVESGLEKDDRILLEGIKLIKDNQSLKYKVISADSVLNHLDLYSE